MARSASASPRAGRLERPAHADPLVLANVYELPHADVGVQQIRTTLGHRQADGGAETVPEKEDLPLPEAGAQELDQFDGVDNDIVLISLATGVIIDSILDVF